MARPALRLLDSASVSPIQDVARDTARDAARPPRPRPLSGQVEPGRLLELSGSTDAEAPSARTTTAVSLVRDAQLQGETTAWVQPRGGPLYPPDLHDNGVDLEALVVVHVPPGPEPGASSRSGKTQRSDPRRHRVRIPAHRLCKAAEVLLRSGAFGLVVVDFCQDAPPPGSEAWQGRLLGLARQHESTVVFLTEKPTSADSLGTLVGLRIEPKRHREAPGRFRIEHEVVKNKSGAPLQVAPDHVRGPWGLR